MLFFQKNEPLYKLFRYSLCKEGKMDNISKLLKGAKPLYFERKRQSRQIKSCIAVLLCIAGFSLYAQQNTLNFNIEEELYLAENGGYIEDLGLETDEYGLLRVI